MDKIQEVLINLINHDLEACEVYKEALEQIENGELYQKISTFLRENERHIEEISKALKVIKYQEEDISHFSPIEFRENKIHIYK